MSMPTNIVDAVAGIRNGTIGIQQVMIGDLVVNVLNGLQIIRQKEVTRRPVQAGYSVDLGVIDLPLEIRMRCIFTNPDYSPEGLITAGLTGSLEALTMTWVEKRDRLYGIFNGKEIVSATTHDQSFPAIFIVDSVDDIYDPEEDGDGYIGEVHLVQFGVNNSATVDDVAQAKTAAKAMVGGL